MDLIGRGGTPDFSAMVWSCSAMIARAGWFRLGLGERSDWTLDARADLPLPGLEALPEPLHARHP